MTSTGTLDLHQFADQRIFVQLACYRDSELPLTIASALSEARHPEHVRFGICLRYDDDTEHDLDPWLDDPRFEIDAVPHETSRGACWARSRANDLFDDEPYYLQIDAHTRFARHWDSRFITMLESIDSERPLLTTYPPSYTKNDDGSDVRHTDAGVQKLALRRVRPNLTTEQQTVPIDDLSRPGPSPLLAAGQIFTHGHFCRAVPYDPELYFSAEEISMALRAFTHGYDLFHPIENLIWHLYDHGAPLHWHDRPDHESRDGREIDRLRVLIEGDAKMLGRFGLGTERTREEYVAYSGVDFTPASVRSEPCRIHGRLRLDTAGIDPRDDYEIWVFALMMDNEEEIFRRDITSPDVLDGSRDWVYIDAELPARPSLYLLWPARLGGEWGPRRLHPLPEKLLTALPETSG